VTILRQEGIRILVLASPLLLWATGTWAQEAAVIPTPPAINGADTAWVLFSSALVLMMAVPGLALFYGGQVRSKNALGTMLQSFVILCLVSLLWVLWGYSLTFGPDRGGVIGGLEWVALSGVGGTPNSAYAPTIPHLAFALFQLMFAAFTPALIAGAFAERMRFSAMLCFIFLWSLFVYSPVAHWLWGGGWLAKLGALDFAGGAVVHLASGASGLACAVALGRRRGYRTEYMAPHSLPLTLVGSGLLWVGWFGFNGGSARGANMTAVGAIMASHTAAATAALTWMAVEWMHRGKPTLLGTVTGAVAGLATITPAAGYIGPGYAVIFGAAGGALCYAAIVCKGRMGYDDPLDVVGIHGVGGIVGLLATGFFASKAVNPLGADGFLFGNPGQVGIQGVAVIAVAIFCFVATYAILKMVDGLIGLRVSPEEEATGLDLSQHNERAYS
jgi:Amt family ammonium transporter